MRHSSALLLSFALCPTLSSADVPLTAAKAIECYCTNTSGHRVELGQTICLFVDGKAFMAQCQMSQNVPMWRKVEETCLSAHLSPIPQSLPRL